jgi:hypothetical protein
MKTIKIDISVMIIFAEGKMASKADVPAVAIWSSYALTGSETVISPSAIAKGLPSIPELYRSRT